ncbi:hypothetical protein [Bradyrhizobium sp. A5]|uniref:DUF6894 family protein n=1 Tax=Bradyrhizobium sp. A5 TaxID=3133696 RepID=UPI0035C7E47A
MSPRGRPDRLQKLRGRGDLIPLANAPYIFVTGRRNRTGLIQGVRYYFHIVDKYGLSTDEVGFEHADRDAAIQHARRIAAELTKAGDFFGMGVVLVALAAVPRALSTNCRQSRVAPET